MRLSEGPRQKLCADAHYNKDLAKYNLKDYYGAITDYTKAIELNPDYAGPKYSHKKYEEDVLDSPLFHDIQIVTTTDEKQRMDRVCAYEEKHVVEIL